MSGYRIWHGLLALMCALVMTGISAPISIAAGDETEKKEVESERLSAWPEVDDKAVGKEVSRLRKARTEVMGDEARAALLAIGSGAAPGLLSKLGHEKDEDAIARICEVLEAVTDARHTRLLAPYFTDKSSAVRVWSLNRVSGFPDPELRAASEKAYASADGKKRGRDAAEVLAAAICCASTGSFIGFEAICDDVEENWALRKSRLYSALSGLRGAEASERVVKRLEADSRAKNIAALRLFSACGDEKHAKKYVVPFLDSSDNGLLIGAINALRGIMDGDPPITNLSVFQAFEEAKKWKERM
ncbi:MAG: hypothetical protein ACI8X5_001581 [Planctomycetota bacterium]|jgi:hypothetical protein